MAPLTDRLALRLGAILALFAVILGAISAHPGDRSLHDYLQTYGRLDAWRTGLTYQWYHALALLAIGQGRTARRGTVICWLVGTVLFSGSLYLLALAPSQKWAGPLTPLGGLFLILGWAWLWLSLIRKSES
jgi:uncharacterized membrane protein YgdD (TMEM256/DUF423 family)